MNDPRNEMEAYLLIFNKNNLFFSVETNGRKNKPSKHNIGFNKISRPPEIREKSRARTPQEGLMNSNLFLTWICSRGGGKGNLPKVLCTVTIERYVECHNGALRCMSKYIHTPKYLRAAYIHTRVIKTAGHIKFWLF